MLEAVAAHHPVGLTLLCELTGEDKSALQRTLATLHEEDWVRPAVGAPPRWEPSVKLLVISERARSESALYTQARRAITALRDELGETAHFALLSAGTIVVADVADGTHVVRTAIPIGQVHPIETSASGRVICAHLAADDRAEITSAPESLLSPAEFAVIHARGWATNTGSVLEGSNSVAAAVLDGGGRPIGAVAVSGPATRLTPERYEALGSQVLDAAKWLTA